MPTGKPIDNTTKQTIREMYQTCSKNRIAKTLGINRRTVIRILSDREN
jgi:DNA invertase Pin-like site-specific DNA recombinase